jgi:hypothetical protein
MATLLRNQMVLVPSLKKSFGKGLLAPDYSGRDYTDANAELASSIPTLAQPASGREPIR